MTHAEAEAFIQQFANARAAGRGEALWDPRGRLHYPLTDRIIGGNELGALNDLTARQAPHLTWEMLDWTFRGAVIVVEWRCTNRYGDKTVQWSGVDKLTLEDGKIVEEVVYTDTAPLRSLGDGRALDPLIQLPHRGTPLS